MDEYVDGGELNHHGIKGMRWGVRRFQNKDGSLTPSGEKRYNDDSDTAAAEKQKSSHRLALEEKYKKAGLSEEAAQKQAAKRIRTEKILAATAAVSIAACTAYAIRKRLKDKTDGLITKSASLQRIEMRDTKGKLNEVFYASTNDRDNARYKAMLGLTRNMQTGEAYLMNIHANRDIKVASKYNAAKIFGELYKSDPEFRIRADKYTRAATGLGIKNLANTNNLSDRNIRKLYENFNSNLPVIRESESGIDKQFFKKLKAAGYGAIQDVNDMKFSGYNAKNPLIIFDKPKSVKVESVTKIANDTKLLKSAITETTKSYGESFVKKTILSEKFAVGVTSLTVASYLADRRTKGPTVSNKTLVKDFVRTYRQQHPNSKLSDREIMDMYNKK